MATRRRIEVWKAPDGDFHYHLVSNGRIMDEGGGYARRWTAKRAARTAHPGVPVIDKDR